MRNILGVSWTKIGTVASLGATVLSQPELGSLVPAEYLPGILIGINLLMGVKKFCLPSENYREPANGRKLS